MYSTTRISSNALSFTVHLRRMYGITYAPSNITPQKYFPTFGASKATYNNNYVGPPGTIDRRIRSSPKTKQPQPQQHPTYARSIRTCVTVEPDVRVRLRRVGIYIPHANARQISRARFSTPSTAQFRFHFSSSARTFQSKPRLCCWINW